MVRLLPTLDLLQLYVTVPGLYSFSVKGLKIFKMKETSRAEKGQLTVFSKFD